MLPQHDPLFMQAPADNEGRRRKKSPSLCSQTKLQHFEWFTSFRKSSAEKKKFFADIKGVVIITVTHEAILDRQRETKVPEMAKTLARHMSWQSREHVPLRLWSHSPLSLPLNLPAKKKRIKDGAFLLASRCCVICWGHLRSPVAALLCSLCQRWCWNRCVPHPGLGWNQLQSETMWQMIPI